jgi:DNA-binding transcriptional MerR regulator
MMQGVQGRLHRPTESLTIGQLAGRTGISAKAIRYYESIGLLPRAPRGANSYRRYGTPDVNRLRLLRRIRLLGVPLSLAKPLLVGASSARCADVLRELLALVDKRLRSIDQEISDLQRLRSDVEGYQRRLEACYAETGETNEQFSACLEMSWVAPPGGEKEGYADDCLECAV